MPVIKLDEPPLDTKGSGCPVTGTKPTATAMLAKACMSRIVPMPITMRPVPPGALLGDIVGAHKENHVEEHDEKTACESEFFADNGEDEIGIGRGQVVALH